MSLNIATAVISCSLEVKIVDGWMQKYGRPTKVHIYGIASLCGYSSTTTRHNEASPSSATIGIFDFCPCDSSFQISSFPSLATHSRLMSPCKTEHPSRRGCFSPESICHWHSVNGYTTTARRNRLDAPLKLNTANAAPSLSPKPMIVQLHPFTLHQSLRKTSPQSSS